MYTKYQKHTLHFKVPGGTSRGILREKSSWFLMLEDSYGRVGVGECSIIEGLNPETAEVVEKSMTELVEMIQKNEQIDRTWFGNKPSVLFAYEMATRDLENGGERKLFDGPLLQGESIKINGLVWMGDYEFMQRQIIEKIEAGYDCIKLKIAAIAFEEEISLIRKIRQEFSAEDIQIRVDANGGFAVEEALEKLKRLSDLEIHSIEQPIKPNKWDSMAKLVKDSPLDMALDEELIGVKSKEKKQDLLDAIDPQYIILKPSLVGGFRESEEWIALANERNIGWWITSALESNIGLNAIAQWTSTLRNDIHQGLGTGQLFTNNFESPLYIEQGHLYHGDTLWDLTALGIDKQ